jgi:predicted transcriptional regulator
MTPEVKTALMRLLEVKHKLEQSGGSSPFCRLYSNYQQEQRFVLGIFGLPDRPEYFRLFDQPIFDFAFDGESPHWAVDTPIVYDGTSLSMQKEVARQFLLRSRGIHLQNMDEQAERLFNRLYTKANKYYGRDGSED